MLRFRALALTGLAALGLALGAAAATPAQADELVLVHDGWRHHRHGPPGPRWHRPPPPRYYAPPPRHYYAPPPRVYYPPPPPRPYYAPRPYYYRY